MVVGLVRSTWTRCSVVGLSSLSRSVHMVVLECTTVSTARTQESSVLVGIYGLCGWVAK